ncbi:2TM domain-containing protein [Polaribacter vadi]|uniref:2TM domain-containing protein n=1 Tax=Polaribacter TaxID=52959 RepID=UPI001C0A2C87|nr:MULTISPECIES: 2TM domain-containing protein [Polaribacter]MBU3012587.1 2TM domain-containing protein [Polaribacter vadi]MDO6742404.1 2TM domain-containing protein [Polaribacter sp. 1_MG-2023]
MEREFTEEQKYILARKRVEKISKFYKHLAVYVVVNTFLSIIFITGDMNDGDSFTQAVFYNNNYKIWLFWGIGIAFQALNTFGVSFFFNKDWEKRKIKKYMEEQNYRR